jgi:uncharacterized membrane protein YedE/YeeE
LTGSERAHCARSSARCRRQGAITRGAAPGDGSDGRSRHSGSLAIGPGSGQSCGRIAPAWGFALSWFAALLLAAIVGFAIQKGGLCTVLAIREVIEQRRATRLLAFLLCVVVVAALVHPLRWLGLLDGTPVVHHAPAVAALAGGMLFGIGAVVNGTCAFGSIAHLGRGETSFLLLLPGLAAGYLAAEWLPGRLQPRPFASLLPLSQPELPALAVVAGAAALVIAAVLRLWRERQHAPVNVQRLLREPWPAAAAAVLIGIAAGLLYGAHGPWAYTDGVQRAVDAVRGTQLAADAADLALFASLFLALITGSLAGAAAQRTLQARRPRARQMARSLAGGALMGAGGSMIPGANDALIFYAMPDLALHAWTACVFMCVAIGRTLMFTRHVAITRRRRRQA